MPLNQITYNQESTAPSAPPAETTNEFININNIPVATSVYSEAIPVGIPINLPQSNSVNNLHVKIKELENKNKILNTEIYKLQDELRREKQKQLSHNIIANFHLQQAHLLEKYITKINLASDYRSIGNYNKAIQEYESSIAIINELIGAYKNAERAKGVFFANVPATYENYILQMHLEIASCLVNKGDLEQAYDYLSTQSALVVRPDAIKARQREYRNLIIKHVNNITTLASNISDKEEESKLNEALKLLNTAEKLLIKISEPIDKNLSTQKLRIEWLLERKKINNDAYYLLNTQINLKEYNEMTTRIKELIALYTKFTPFLNFQELTNKTKLSSILPSFEQVSAQLQIDELMPKVNNLLFIGDILNAHALMKEVCTLEMKITNPELIVQKELIYHQPEYYYNKLDELANEVSNFEARANQQHGSIVDLIMNKALEKISSESKKATFLEKDQTALIDTLNVAVKDNWFKFDRRAEPINLIEKIADLIEENSNDTSTYERWRYWSYATTSLKQESAFAAIKAHINDYIPESLPESALDKSYKSLIK